MYSLASSLKESPPTCSVIFLCPLVPFFSCTFNLHFQLRLVFRLLAMLMSTLSPPPLPTHSFPPQGCSPHYNYILFPHFWVPFHLFSLIYISKNKLLYCPFHTHSHCSMATGFMVITPLKPGMYQRQGGGTLWNCGESTGFGVRHSRHSSSVPSAKLFNLTEP